MKRKAGEYNGRILTGKFAGCYAFPDVKYTSGEQVHTWTVYLCLVARPLHTTINWEYKASDIIPLTPGMLQDEKLPKAVVQIWTESGINNMSRSIPTYIDKGKNIGKKNETTIVTQGLSEARSKYLKKLQSSSDRTDIKRFYPVAVHKYDEPSRKVSNHIVYPVAVQRKLDGGRAVAYKDGKSYVMYTRRLKDIVMPHIVDTLNRLPDCPGAYFDGELYEHGLPLQEISGIMRLEHDDPSKLKLKFHIFDVFFPTKPNIPYTERRAILDRVLANAPPELVNVETLIADTAVEETQMYERFLNEGYEGSIVRNLANPYEFGSSKEKRSYFMRKRKPRHDSEFKITGYTEGKHGKDSGALIWVLVTDKGREFTLTPVGMTYAERYALYAAMPDVFNSTYNNKMMTVEYDDLSVDGIPLRAKARGLRLVD
jgi:ATP-dependent DNA ligase